MVTVFGTNRLGTGPPLNSTFTGIWRPIAILFIQNKLSQHTICFSEFTNNFIDLSVHQQNSTEAAPETTEMESGVYEDIRAESHTIKTECNEAYNYVIKHQTF